jgi:hypothetical protein
MLCDEQHTTLAKIFTINEQLATRQAPAEIEMMAAVEINATRSELTRLKVCVDIYVEFAWIIDFFILE